MSNQFPPSGYNQGDQNSGQNQNQGGYNAADQSNSGYSASSGSYQGYQSQSNYQGYGQQGSGDSSYSSYGDQGSSSSSYGQQSSSDQSYSSYGQNSQPSYGQSSSSSSYGQSSSQQVYGQSDAQQQSGGYGQQSSSSSYGSYGQSGQSGQQSSGYGQDSNYSQSSSNQGSYGQQDQNSYGSGNYSNNYSQQQPKKKGFPAWAWILIALAVIALIAGGIWGAMSLFGGGIGGNKGYSLNSDKTVEDVDIDYNGDWESTSFGSEQAYADSAGECNFVPAFVEGELNVDGDDIEGSIESNLDDSIGSEGEFERLGNVTKSDTEGTDVEFMLIKVTDSGANAVGYAAVHPFSDSGDGIVFLAFCSNSSALDEDGFKDLIADTDFTLHPADDK